MSREISVPFDSSGIDLVILFKPFSLHADWQIKKSANGKTAAIVMPPHELPEDALLGLSSKMAGRILRDVRRHERKHPRCFLFVGGVSRHNSEEKILGDIWEEIVKAYREVKARQG